MKKLTILIVAVLVLGLTGVLMAADPTDDNVIGGDIPFLSTWTITGDAHTTSLSTVAASDMETGTEHIEFVDFFDCTEFDANDSIKVSVKIHADAWTVPARYPASGSKKTIDSDTDLNLKVTNIVEADDSLEYMNSSDSYFEVVSDNTEIISSTTSHGMNDAAFQCDLKVDLDWEDDVPAHTGDDYSCKLTFTVAQETPAE